MSDYTYSLPFSNERFKLQALDSESMNLQPMLKYRILR